MHLISLQNQSMQYHTVNYNTMYDIQCTKTNNFVINAKFQKGIIPISWAPLLPCTVHSAHCTVHSSHCNLHSGQFTVHSARCTVQLSRQCVTVPACHTVPECHTELAYSHIALASDRVTSKLILVKVFSVFPKLSSGILWQWARLAYIDLPSSNCASGAPRVFSTSSASGTSEGFTSTRVSSVICQRFFLVPNSYPYNNMLRINNNHHIQAGLW